MHVHVWMHPSAGGAVQVRLLCPTSIAQSGKVDVVEDEYSLLKQWLECNARAASMTQQQRAGRHFRARRIEATAEALTDAIEDTVTVVLSPQWSISTLVCSRSLPATLDHRASSAVRYLCLLRTRMPRWLPAEVWTCVCLHVLPCVQRFGFRKGQAWVTLRPLPAIQWLEDSAMGELLTRQDAEHNRALRSAYAVPALGDGSESAGALRRALGTLLRV